MSPKSNWWIQFNENKKVSDFGWEIYPEGIYRVLKELGRYNKPIYITENGIAAVNDDKRIRFIVGHLKEVYHAIESGVDAPLVMPTQTLPLNHFFSSSSSVSI